MLLVSACLCGEKCKYNGRDNKSIHVLEYCSSREILKVCPEVLGGLDTPRIPAEIVGGTAKDVLLGRAFIKTKEGVNVTPQFLKGAYATLQVAQKYNIKEAIFKAKSPSCGRGSIYNGCFSGTLISGNGLTTELLLQSGIHVKTELELPKDHQVP